MRTYVKVFIVITAIGIIPDIFIDGLTSLSVASVKGSVITGLIMTVLLCPVYNYLRKQPGNCVPISEKVTVDASYSDAFEICTDSLKLVGKYTVMKQDEQQGVIQIKREQSFFAPSEELTYIIQAVNSNQTSILIESKSFVDEKTEYFRKNRENVHKVAAYISRLQRNHSAM